MNYFGIHLTLDMYGGDTKKLASKQRVMKSVRSLPARLKMNKLFSKIGWAEPNIDLGGKDTGGWSAVTVIQESHITIHTFPKIGFASIDVYTCKGTIDDAFVEDWFKEFFDFQDCEKTILKRGLRFADLTK